MTKKLTATQIEGYKRNAISANNNNKKTTQPKITMKFFTAALLAIGAAAIKLKDDGTQGPPEAGEGGEFPFPPPDCTDKPDDEGWGPEDYFNHADANGSGGIDAHEGFNSLYCAVVWGEMKQEEAEWLYEFLSDHADLNEDGDPDELDKSEA